MKIRKAKLDDVERLSILFDGYRVFYKKQTDPAAALSFLTARISNSESEIFVAENEAAQLVGFVQLYPIFSSTRLKRLWLLNDLFVSQDQRGKGVSLALIERCKELCCSTDSCGMILETAKSNSIGNNLYHKTGFTLDSDHNYYEWETQ